MKVALIQCPAWLVDTPQHAHMLLAASLTQAGHHVWGFDINIELYNRAQKASELSAEWWLSQHIESFWCNRNNVLLEYRNSEAVRQNILEQIRDLGIEAVCFTVHFTSLYFTDLFAADIRRQFENILICWGGPWCFRPHNNLKQIVHHYKYVDIACESDAHESLPALLSSIETNQNPESIAGYYIRSIHQNQIPTACKASGESIETLAFSELQCWDTSAYSFKYFPIWVSKACVNRCAFCYECNMHTKYSFRDPDNIVAEILHQKSQEPFPDVFWFNASNIGGNPVLLKALCQRLIASGANIQWLSQIAVHKSIDPEMLSLLKQSGCKSLYFGIESGSNRVLKFMNKKFTVEEAESIILRTANAGIEFNFNMIVGFPGETVLDFARSLWFIRKFLKYNINPSTATCKISEGSRLFRYPEKYGVSGHHKHNWISQGGSNNSMSRKWKKVYLDALYTPRPANGFRLAKWFHDYIRYNATNNGIDKKMNFKIALSRLGVFLSESFSAIPFMLFVVLAVSHVGLLQWLGQLKKPGN